MLMFHKSAAISAFTPSHRSSKWQRCRVEQAIQVAGCEVVVLKVCMHTGLELTLFKWKGQCEQASYTYI